MSSITVTTATIFDAPKIMACTNEAFMADAFFKKEEYHLRFTLDNVTDHINEENSLFLIVSEESNPELYGSILLKWDISEIGGESSLNGHFSALSVPSRFGRRGIGKMLVKAAEAKILEFADSKGLTNVVMDMGVINVREELFPWYEAQGYSKYQRLPDTEEVARVKLDNIDIHCILMQKILRRN